MQRALRKPGYAFFFLNYNTERGGREETDCIVMCVCRAILQKQVQVANKLDIRSNGKSTLHRTTWPPRGIEWNGERKFHSFIYSKSSLFSLNSVESREELNLCDSNCEWIVDVQFGSNAGRRKGKCRRVLQAKAKARHVELYVPGGRPFYSLLFNFFKGGVSNRCFRQPPCTILCNLAHPPPLRHRRPRCRSSAACRNRPKQ